MKPRQGRPSKPLPADLARALGAISEAEKAYSDLADGSRRELGLALAVARGQGYSVRTLADATGRSPTRVQALIREA